MPKATLQFNLDDEFEKDAHTRAIKADKAYGALWDLMNYFREIRKYGDRPEAELAIFTEAEDQFYKVLSESGIDLFEEYK